MADRSSCSFCGGKGRVEYGATSRFFAKVTKGATSSPVAVFQCSECGCRQFLLPLTASELDRLYDGYRSEKYFTERHASEPWYTRSFHDRLGRDADWDSRRRLLLDVLQRGGVANAFDNVLDHGGDRGQMLAPGGGLNAKRRFLYDVSGARPVEGVQSLAANELMSVDWDLILSCHVMEHALSPEAYLDELIRIGRAGTWYYFELPLETYRASDFIRSAAQRKWLEWLCKTDLPFMLADFVSTGIRVKYGYIPPFCFHPVREHLQFFTVEGLRKFMSRAGLEVLLCDSGDAGPITALARKH